MDDDSYDFSFSGIKSAVINFVHNEKQRGNEVNVYDLVNADVVVMDEVAVNKLEEVLK